MSHSMMQKVNSFALRAFRDTADRDYIHARMAYRADLFPNVINLSCSPAQGKPPKQPAAMAVGR